MFDTMTFTKILGGFCGALLIFLLGNWAAETLYHVGAESHGDEEHAQAYVIDTGAEEDSAEGGGEQMDFAEVLASADPGRGERVFNKCRACHKLEDGANGTGPHLYGVVGREVGSVPGFSYSGALVEVAEVWSPENLDGFLEDPKGWAPGTKMSFSGLPDVEDRANLIAYLDTIGE